MTTKTLTGPDGIRIELDSAQIFPDDPGQGTPAMVYHGKYGATYNCALDTDELDCGQYTLTGAQSRWLERVCEEVDAWLTEHGA